MTEEERQGLFKRIADRLTWMDNWSLTRYIMKNARAAIEIRAHLQRLKAEDNGVFTYQTWIPDEYLIKYNDFLTKIIK